MTKRFTAMLFQQSIFQTTVRGLCLATLFFASTGIIRGQNATLAVPGDHATIQAAVDAANPGDTVEVGPGTYAEQLLIETEALLLAAADSENPPVLHGGGSGTGIEINGAGDVTIRGFEIRDYVTAIRVEESPNVTIEENAIIENDWALRDFNTGSHGMVIADNRFEDIQIRGIYIEGSNEVEIRGNHFTDSSSEWAIQFGSGNANGGNSVLIEANTLSDAGGIFIWMDAPTIRDNTIEVANGVGIHLRRFTGGRADDAVIENNTIAASGTGISVSQVANTEIRNNTVFGGGIDINLSSVTGATVFNNTLQTGLVLEGSSAHADHEMGNNTVGGRPLVFLKNEDAPTIPSDAAQIIIVNGTNVAVSGFTLESVASGIQIFNTDWLEISGNTVTDNLSSGISITGSEHLEVRNNQVSNNGGNGITVSSSPEAVITNNTLTGNEGIALQISSSSAVSLTDNVITYNYESLRLSSSDDADITDNTITGTHHGGGNLSSFRSAILVLGSKNATFTGNTISDNAANGIHDNRSNGPVFLTMVNNVISGNGNQGIYWGSAPDATFHNNIITDNGSTGLNGGSRATVTNNTISGNSGSGIDVSHNSTVEDNDVFDNGSIGISVNANSTVRNNVITNNGNTGISLNRFSGQIIENNVVSGHDVDLSLRESSDVTVRDNTFETGVYLSSWSVDFDELATHTFTNNTVGGAPLFYAAGINAPVIPDGAGQIILVDVSNATISGRTFENVVAPIQIALSENVEITDNTLSGDPSRSNTNGPALVTFLTTDNVEISGNTLRDDVHGIEVERGTGLRIEDNKISGTRNRGIIVDLTEEVRIENNTISTTQWLGILVERSPDLLLIGNQLDGVGIRVDRSPEARIENNSIVDSISDGLEIGGPSDNTLVSGNTIIGSSDSGIDIRGGEGYLISNNTVTENGDWGITALITADGDGAEITGNTIARNGAGLQLRASGFRADLVGVLVRANTVEENNGAGIAVEDDAELVEISNNRISSNGSGVEYNERNPDYHLDARNNWWGDPSGPGGNVTDPETGVTASGSGDSVDENVLFDPWQTEEAARHEVTLSAVPEQGGTVSGGGEVPEGDSMTVTAEPAQYYEFVRWTVNGSEVSTEAVYTFTVSETRELVAEFQLEGGFDHLVTLNASPVGGGTVTGEGPYLNEEEVTVTATANAGYAFVAWTEDGAHVSDNSSLSFMIVGNRNLTAQFVSTQHTIMATSGGNGTIFPEGEIQVDEGMSVQFEFAADPGYGVVEIVVNGRSHPPAFNHWLENVTEDHAIHVTFGREIDSDITVDTTWTAADGPYLVLVPMGVREGATLTIEPGAGIYFEQNAGMFVEGVLHAVGTAGQPITISGTHRQPGWWRDILIRNTGSAVMEWVNLAHGGQGWVANAGAVRKSGAGSFLLRDSTLRESASSALVLDGSTGGHEIERARFLSNRTGVFVRDIAAPLTLSGSRFEENRNFAVEAIRSAEVDARHVWWGDPSGPHHPDTHPAGMGDSITDGVRFNPWSRAKIVAPRQSGTLVAGDEMRFRGVELNDASAGYRWNFSDGRVLNDLNPEPVTLADEGLQTVLFSPVTSGETEPFPDRRFLEVVADTGDIADLRVAEFEVPELVNVNETFEVTYSVENVGEGPLRHGAWNDVLYLSENAYLESSDIPLIQRSRNGSIEPEEGYQESMEISLAGLVTEGDFYLILSIDDEWEVLDRRRLNNQEGLETEVILPDLAAGQTHTVAHGEGDLLHYYRVDAEAGHNPLLSFDANGQGIEVLAAEGRLPSAADFDLILRGGGLLIPTPEATTWYVLVEADNLSASGSYTIGRENHPLAVVSVDPDRGSLEAAFELTVTGAGFQGPMAVMLVDQGGNEYPAESVQAGSYESLTATFSEGSVPIGTHNLRVVRSADGEERIGPGAIEIHEFYVDAGIIAEDTEWEGNVLVEGNVRVETGATLTLLPGTEVSFETGAGIDVHGRLELAGTLDEPVVLRSARLAEPAPGDWEGIRVFENGHLHLEHFEIAHATSGIRVDPRMQRRDLNIAIKLLNGTIRESERYGLYTWQPFVVVDAENCVITNSGFNAIFARAEARLHFRNCTLVGNGFQGTGQSAAAIHHGAPRLTLDNCILAFNANGIHHSGGEPEILIRHSLFHNPEGGNYVGSLDDRPHLPALLSGAGNIVNRDPLFVDLQGGDYELDAFSPAIDAAGGQKAPATDIFGRSRFNDPGLHNMGTGLPAYVDIGAFERQEASAPAADLTVQTVQVSPTDVESGDSLSISWTVANTGNRDLDENWTDAVYLSPDPIFNRNASLLLAEVSRSDGLNQGDSYTAEIDVEVPSGVAGPQYVIVRTNNGRSFRERDITGNTRVGGQSIAVNVPGLDVDGPALSGSVEQGGWTYFRIELEAGRSVHIQLESDRSSGTVGLFLQRGRAPTLSEHDEASVASNSPDQDLRIRSAEGGVHYLGIRGVSTGSGFTLSARGTTLDIREISPTVVGNQGAATLRIAGDDFTPGTEAELIPPGGGVPIEGSIWFEGVAVLYATFDLAGATTAPGDHDLVLREPGGGEIAWSEAVRVEDGGFAEPEIEVILPGMSRPGRRTEITVEITNHGNLDLKSPFLTMDAQDMDAWLGESFARFDDEASAPPPDAATWIESGIIHFLALSQDGPASTIRPGETTTVTFQGRTPFAVIDRMCFRPTSFGASPTAVSTATLPAGESNDPLDQPIDWDEVGSQIRPGGLTDPEWADLLQEIRQSVGETWGDYLDYLRDRADLLAAAGERNALANSLFDIDGEFESASAPAPGPFLPGWSDWPFRCQPNRPSITPEDKFGPEGFDPEGVEPGERERFILEAGRTMGYRVDFWNDEEAEVPTQDAVIVDHINPDHFDLTTFEFTRIGFLDWDMPLKNGLQVIEARIDPRPEMNIVVDVEATFDPETGEIEWWFRAIDPETGDYPLDPMAGFLPPINPETMHEIGWVEYRVRARPNLPSETRIVNQAFVQFDFMGPWGPAPPYGPWVNTIDSEAPVSWVEELPATSPPDFTVSWSANAASGIAAYNIYVREDSGSWQLWQANTSDETAVFTGEDGSTYDFYAVSVNNLGIEEAFEPSVEASTTVEVRVPTPRETIAEFFALAESDVVPGASVDSPWLGSFTFISGFEIERQQGWLLHKQHGWIYWSGTGWFWRHSQQIWHFMNESNYPFVYGHEAGWFYFDRNSPSWPGRQWFYDYNVEPDRWARWFHRRENDRFALPETDVRAGLELQVHHTEGGFSEWVEFVEDREIRISEYAESGSADYTKTGGTTAALILSLADLDDGEVRYELDLTYRSANDGAFEGTLRVPGEDDLRIEGTFRWR